MTFLKLMHEKHPPHSALSHTNRRFLFWDLLVYQYKRIKKRLSLFTSLFYSLSLFGYLCQNLCVLKHICHQAVQTFPFSLLSRPCCPPGAGSIPCWMTPIWLSDAVSLASSTERRKDISSVRYSPENVH